MPLARAVSRSFHEPGNARRDGGLAMRTISSKVGLLAAVMALGVALGVNAATSTATPTRSTADSPFEQRGDIRHLPDALQDRLELLANRPTTFTPMTAFSEAPTPSRLFQYYLLDTRHFQPNVFTTTIPGINDGVAPSATGPNHDLPTLGATRVVVEPKPGSPTDPNNPGAFVDMFTDISGLFVINNESGWYEGWMIHDLIVPRVAPPRADGHAQFGTMTAADASAIWMMGDHNNVPGKFFTTDGKEVHIPSMKDHFPDKQSNLVGLSLSMGAYNCTQQ